MTSTLNKNSGSTPPSKILSIAAVGRLKATSWDLQWIGNCKAAIYTDYLSASLLSLNWQKRSVSIGFFAYDEAELCDYGDDTCIVLLDIIIDQLNRCL